ncbi:MAG: hypothetical protein ABGW81_06100, partial [Paracoccaceae bacterium]
DLLKIAENSNAAKPAEKYHAKQMKNVLWSSTKYLDNPSVKGVNSIAAISNPTPTFIAPRRKVQAKQ